MSRSAYRPTDRFVLRTPLLPWDHGRPLVELAGDPAVREALALASPELEADLDAWLAAPESPHGTRVARAFARYAARMAGRATPFGLTAGVSLGTLGPETRLELAPRAQYRRAVRLDHDYLGRVCDALARELRAHLTHVPSSSLYALGDRLRYVEVRRPGGETTHHLVELERSAELDVLLARARTGATPAQLVDALCADPEVEREQAEAFVDELIDTQVLVPELAVPVTGDDAVAAIAAQLDRAGAAGAAGKLVTAERTLAAMNGGPRHAYETITGALPEGSLRALRADLYKPARATLGPHVVHELHRALDLLAVVGAPHRHDPWPEFRAAFEARYGTREVPLVEALDEETGIGFGEHASDTAPLVAEVGIAAEPAPPPTTTWGAREARLVELATRGTHEVELTDDDLAQLARPAGSRPPATVLVGAVLGAASPQAVDAGEFTLRMIGVGGPGPRPLARMCGESDELASLVRELIVAEDALVPDAVFAEIVHVPEGRAGNVVWRPVLRGHELVYLGASGAPRERQLPVTDLVVALAGNRVVLRSQALGREVIPRLTSAHDFTRHSLAIYRFLSAHAWQDGQPARWSWGVLEDAAFLPRVRHGRLVLARARWVLSRDELAGGLPELRARRGLPRHLVLADDDRELPVDLDDAGSADMFADRVKRRPRAIVHEMFPAPDALVAHGPEGRYVHELVVPFVRSAPVERHRVPAPVAVERRFPPGSRWLYAKLYGGVAGADRVLRDVIAPMVRGGEAWFFVRYRDPDPHLRVRWCDREAGELIDELRSRLADAGEPCWRVVLDTYEREVERYGGPRGIELAEQVFAADSEAVLSLLAEDLDDDRRTLLALRGIDALLDDLGLSLADKLALVTAARDAYGEELGVATWHHKRLGELYRARKPALEEVLAADVPAFTERSSYVRPLVSELRACDRPIDDLARSFVHMHANRMLASAQRAQELVLCDLLRRHYAAVAARASS
ncbi:MAG: lantibiotic dehydratase [Acidobacteriota bacterium]